MIKALLRTSESAYEVAALTLDSFRSAGYAVRRHKLLFKQLYEVGNRSLFIVTVMACFIGMILAMQSGYQLRRFNQEKQIGLIGLIIIREFGPVITAFILAGRIGSAYAAEIGTMTVYEEVDALKVMGIKPVAYLVSPRLLACLIMVPLLVVYADFVAMLGGALIARVYTNVEPATYFRVFFQWMTMKEGWHSLTKATLFGGIIAITGCFFGLRTRGGAEGVGRSTTQSVVVGLLAVLVCDYFIGKILLAF